MIRRRPYFGFSIVLLTCLAAFISWLGKFGEPLSTTPGVDFFRQPDYIIENISGARVDHDNTIHRVFHAKEMFHYLNQEITQLEQVRFLNIEPDTPPFRVFADRAELHDNGEHIFLKGNVIVIRGADEDNEKITLKTDTLHLIPEEDMAKTDKSVVITRLNTTVQAIGLELDNHTGMIELLSRVRAVDH